MTERIDIEITDKVASSIRTKIQGIAQASRDADTAVERLKAGLASINDTALTRLNAASNNLTSTINKQLTASARLQQSLQKQTLDETKAATAQQKLAQEIAKTEQANARATAAATRASTATLQQEAASSRLAVAKLREQRAIEAAQNAANKNTGGGSSNRGEDIAAYGAQLDKLRAKYNPLYAAITQYKQQLNDIRQAHSVGAISTDEMTAAISRERQATLQSIANIKARDGAIKGSTNGIKLQGYQIQNLGYQLNDVFVGLASGQKPLTVLIQQGSQIAGIFGPGTGLIGILKGVGQAIAALVLPFAPVIAIVGTVLGAFKLLQIEINKGVDPKQLTQGLNLTSKQLRVLKDDIKVTFGDTFKAVFQVAGKAILDTLGIDVGKLSTKFSDVYNKVLEYTKIFVNGVIGIYKTLSTVIGDVLNIATDPKNVTANLAKVALDVKNFTTDLKKNVSTDYIGGAVGAIKDQAVKNAQSRIKQTATDKGYLDDDGKAAESRAAALAKVNRELDTELNRMQALKPQREAQQQFDQISNDLANKKITLNAQEAASIRQKIAAIQQYKDVQQALDRIYETATGPAREYNATLSAANRLYAEGVINARQYYNEIAAAKIKVLEQQDSISAGVESGFLRIQSSMKTTAATVSDTVVGAFDSLSDTIADTVRTGKFAFNDLASSVVSALVKMTTQLLIIQPLFSIFSGLTGLGSVAAPTGPQAGIGSVVSSGSKLPAFATGGSFEIGGKGGVDQNIVAFRGSKGEHVNVTKGDPSKNTGNVTVNVTNNTSAGVKVQESQSGDGKTIDIIVDELVGKKIRQYGSNSNKALRDTFGISPALNG